MDLVVVPGEQEVLQRHEGREIGRNGSTAGGRRPAVIRRLRRRSACRRGGTRTPPAGRVGRRTPLDDGAQHHLHRRIIPRTRSVRSLTWLKPGTYTEAAVFAGGGKGRWRSSGECVRRRQSPERSSSTRAARRSAASRTSPWRRGAVPAPSACSSRKENDATSPDGFDLQQADHLFPEDGRGDPGVRLLEGAPPSARTSSTSRSSTSTAPRSCG